jgi:hypothetical protein
MQRRIGIGYLCLHFCLRHKYGSFYNFYGLVNGSLSLCFSSHLISHFIFLTLLLHCPIHDDVVLHSMSRCFSNKSTRYIVECEAIYILNFDIFT